MSKQKKLEDYRSLLRIDRDDLDSELMEQQHLASEVGSRYADAVSHRDLCRAELKESDAGRKMCIRTRLMEAHGKVTEAQIDQTLEIDTDHQEDVRRFIAATRDAEDWMSMRDCWAARAFGLKDLVVLFSTAYYTKNSMSDGKLDDRLIAARRKAMTEDREQKRKKSPRKKLT